MILSIFIKGSWSFKFFQLFKSFQFLDSSNITFLPLVIKVYKARRLNKAHVSNTKVMLPRSGWL